MVYLFMRYRQGEALYGRFIHTVVLNPGLKSVRKAEQGDIF